MTMPRISLAVLLALLLMIAAIACSDDDEPEATPLVETPAALSPTQVLVQPEPVQPLDAEFTEATDGVIEVTVEGAAFIGNRLRVPAGSAAKIDVTNRDDQVHNLRIAGFDGVYQTEDDGVTTPDPIAAGGSGSLEFAPAVPGPYTFRCDYHPGSMGGQVIVE
jgi:plastocyanin